VLHLVRRFFASVIPVGPSRADDAWARSHLSEAEVGLWRGMSRVDRRHSARVARRVAADLGDRATEPVLAAALLHDVGKTVAGLGTYGRVVATLSERFAGPGTAEAWSQSRGFTRRVGLYLRYPELGVDLLQMAGSDDLAVAWSAEHHLPPEDWTVPQDIGEALAAADESA
jgi:hypothetical protein